MLNSQANQTRPHLYM